MHRDGRVGTTRSHVLSPNRNSRDTKDSGVSHWISRAKMRRCDFDLVFELQSQSKTVFIENQAKKLLNPCLLNKIGDGTLPRAIHGGTGTRPKVGGAHERSIYFLLL